MAGITDRLLDPAAGLDDRRPSIISWIGGWGSPTWSIGRRCDADELSTAELRQGGCVIGWLEMWRPQVAAVLGVTAYGSGSIGPGRWRDADPSRLGGADLFVLGNPSGLNAHETAASLARSFRTAPRPPASGSTRLAGDRQRTSSTALPRRRRLRHGGEGIGALLQREDGRDVRAQLSGAHPVEEPVEQFPVSYRALGP